MVNLLIEIQKNREIIKKNKRNIKNGLNICLLKKMKREFEEEKLNYKNVNSRIKKIGENIEELEQKINKLKEEVKLDENKLYGNMEYDLKFIQTLEKSIKLKQNDIKKLEEDSLNFMYEEENISKKIIESKKKLVNLKEKFYNYKENNNENIAKAEKRMIEARNSIKDIEQHIPKKLLDKFNELCFDKGTGAAVISNGVCSGCKMKVSAVTIDNIKNNKNIVYCDNCGRIVHYSHSIE